MRVVTDAERLPEGRLSVWDGVVVGVADAVVAVAEGVGTEGLREGMTLWLGLGVLEREAEGAGVGVSDLLSVRLHDTLPLWEAEALADAVVAETLPEGVALALDRDSVRVCEGIPWGVPDGDGVNEREVEAVAEGVVDRLRP